jgi:hypothetical protein
MEISIQSQQRNGGFRWRKIPMPFGFQLKTHSGSKRKRTTSRHKLELPPGRLVDVDTLANVHRKGYMALGGSATSIAVPGRRMLLLQKGSDALKPTFRGTDPGGMDIDDRFDNDDFAPYDFPIRRHETEDTGARKKRKREQAETARDKLVKRWTTEVIPRVLPIYLTYKAHQPLGGILGPAPAALDPPCTCNKLNLLYIIVVYWDCKYQAHSATSLTHCNST